VIGACVSKRDVLSGVARALIGDLEAPAGAGDVHAVFDQVAASAVPAVRNSDRLLSLGRRGRTCPHGTLFRRDLRVPGRGVVVHSRGWAIAGQAARPIRHRPGTPTQAVPTRARPHGHSSSARSAQQALVARNRARAASPERWPPRRRRAPAAPTRHGSGASCSTSRTSRACSSSPSRRLRPAVKARSPGRPAS
jgi:hypothetical protein